MIRNKSATLFFLALSFVGLLNISFVLPSELVGKWVISNSSPEGKQFEDYWQFKSNGKFAELKGRRDNDGTLVPDEQGSWRLYQDTLEIKVVKERGGGRRVYRYDKPQIVKLKIKKESDYFLLIPISDSYNKNFDIIIKLRRLVDK